MRQSLPAGLVGRPVAQHLPRPVIYQAEGPPLLSVTFEKNPLMSPLVFSTIGLLSGAVGLTEVELNAAEGGRDRRMPRELLAPVGRDARQRSAPR